MSEWCVCPNATEGADGGEGTDGGCPDHAAVDLRLALLSYLSEGCLCQRDADCDTGKVCRKDAWPDSARVSDDARRLSGSLRAMKCARLDVVACLAVATLMPALGCRNHLADSRDRSLL